jgi:nitrogen-specific signal transduction histidine kinase/ActR/RegA family two-component response regulator
MAVDITERERLEKQYRQSQKMESIGLLAGGIAHDFNNLLTVIKGYSGLLLSNVGNDDGMRKDIKRIKDAGDRAALLVRQLLTFSRKQMLTPAVLDLNAVIADIETLLRRLIGEDIALTTSLEPELGRAKADPGQIEQVIMNLAVNARDAMPRGGQLIIETKNVELDEVYAQSHVAVQPGPHVMLAVRDTGCGMDAVTQGHLFEPFFTTKGPGNGTGLGLATVYGIVKQSGGHIQVYSVPGNGTTFKIYLPRVEGIRERNEPAPVSTEIPHGWETILLVEDEEEVRTLASTILQMKGYTVLDAQEGAEALHISQSHPGQIHLVLTDMVMPGMSGREVAERLAGARRDIKVMYMSGYPGKGTIHHDVPDPGTTFLQKPFTPEDLAFKVRKALDMPRGDDRSSVG